MNEMNKKHVFQGIYVVVIFYSLFSIVIIGTIASQDPVSAQTLSNLIKLGALIIGFELFEQFLLSIVKVGKALQIFLYFKELVTCLFFSMISLLFASTLMIHFYGDSLLTVRMFNTLIFGTYLTSLTFYSIYLHIDIPKHLDKLQMYLSKTASESNISIKDKLSKKVFLNLIDLFAIFTTIFLLSHSTATGLLTKSEISSQDFFESSEFSQLFIVMAVYVLAAHYKLPLKSND
ncbi:hypothetical protein [Planococcus sp. NCCP-2050]|uniref:hypothetical protein n=1 Tax=Planococcus sp. NCCP-2050 TaxID=2944679 RepID=UPI00203DBA25|nr:hypothetical protein [Planococcus sp. NCCP-2050]GKW46915.1 hypothetical protein NCCP2050_26070 [Planococcus sp. NCCP-2050]